MSSTSPASARRSLGAARIALTLLGIAAVLDFLISAGARIP